jgi:hypothetical protein
MEPGGWAADTPIQPDQLAPAEPSPDLSYRGLGRHELTLLAILANRPISGTRPLVTTPRMPPAIDIASV